VGETNVLRITKTEEQNGHGLTLAGRLEGPWVEVLRNSWEEIRRGNGRAPIPVNLRDASFVDAQGRELLRGMQAQGAVLANASMFLRAMMKIDGTKRQSGNEKGE